MENDRNCSNIEVRYAGPQYFNHSRLLLAFFINRREIYLTIYLKTETFLMLVVYVSWSFTYRRRMKERKTLTVHNKKILFKWTKNGFVNSSKNCWGHTVYPEKKYTLLIINNLFFELSFKAFMLNCFFPLPKKEVFSE